MPVANTLISPIAFYSKKYKSLQDLPPGAKVGIPNDPSNQTRALVVLRDQGLITPGMASIRSPARPRWPM